MTTRFHFADKDVPVTVNRDGDGYRVVCDGEAIPGVVRREGDSWSVETPGGRKRFAALVTPLACHVFGRGRVYTFPKPDPEQDEDEATGGAGPRLVADMPGKVVKVLVAEGDVVRVGQGLIIMESMKMETELSAAVAGTVCAVAVTAGQVVGQGELLVTITPEDSGEQS